MKKKIIDLTNEELNLLCIKYLDCTRDDGRRPNCPLWYGSRCLKGETDMNRYLQKEVLL